MAPDPSDPTDPRDGDDDRPPAPSEDAVPAAPGGMDLGGLLASAQEALSAQAEAAEKTVEGTSGGGVVKVTMTGGGEVTGITLSPEVVDPDEVEMLQDLVLAALRDAAVQVTSLQQEAFGALGNLDLGALGGGPGAGPGDLLGGGPAGG